MDSFREASPPVGGDSFVWLDYRAQRALSAIPLVVVAYFLVHASPSTPRDLAMGLLLATTGLEAISRRHGIAVSGVALLLCAEALLATVLWVIWPPSNGWAILIGVVGATGARLDHRLALVVAGFIGLATVIGALTIAGSVGQLHRDVLSLLVFLGSTFIIAMQRRRQYKNLRRMEAMVVSLRHYSEQLAEAHRQLQLESIQAAALAAAEERNRIAREIHDVLAHSLTVIVVQAQAIKRLVRVDPDGAEAQAETLASVAREGLAEARRSVSTLHVLPAGSDGLEALRSLVARFESQTAMSTTFQVSGPTRELSPNVWATLYRATQEALTNARRHGQAQRVDVHLSIDERIRLTIDDDGSAGTGIPTTDGNGLRGMRERAERLGGAITYGARPSGGFHVEVSLPG